MSATMACKRLLADLGPVARLVAHAAGLAAHAEGAGLAGVLGRIAFHSCHQPTRWPCAGCT